MSKFSGLVKVSWTHNQNDGQQVRLLFNTEEEINILTSRNRCKMEVVDVYSHDWMGWIEDGASREVKIAFCNALIESCQTVLNRLGANNYAEYMNNNGL